MLNPTRLLYLLWLLALPLLPGCGQSSPLADAVRASGELRVATLPGDTTFYAGPHGVVGFEHDLSTAFAGWLGVEVRYVLARDFAHLRELLATNRAHIGAALLPVSRDNEHGLRYGPSYAVGRQLVIHRRGQPRPQASEDLIGWHGASIAGRGAAALLEQELPIEKGHSWDVRSELTIHALLAQLEAGAIDYAVLPSFEFEAAWRNFPELQVGFTLGVPQPVAWIFRAGVDPSWAQTQLEFMRTIRNTGELERIRDRYFGHFDDFDYVDSRAFLRHRERRMPAYQASFQAAGEATGIDWVLLAALSYQESHWREDARSPTGVRGLMMLTTSTAELLDVDRLDPHQSIDGGARYLNYLKQRLPERLDEPDLTWFALAAYNIGLGHLEDARVFAARDGKNPDHWAEVEPYLPKLSNKQWASKARYGAARGYQAVHFVRNVRRYYDVLRRLESTVHGDGLLTPMLRTALVSPVL